MEIKYQDPIPKNTYQDLTLFPNNTFFHGAIINAVLGLTIQLFLVENHFVN